MQRILESSNPKNLHLWATGLIQTIVFAVGLQILFIMSSTLQITNRKDPQGFKNLAGLIGLEGFFGRILGIDLWAKICDFESNFDQ